MRILDDIIPNISCTIIQCHTITTNDQEWPHNHRGNGMTRPNENENFEKRNSGRGREREREQLELSHSIRIHAVEMVTVQSTSCGPCTTCISDVNSRRGHWNSLGKRSQFMANKDSLRIVTDHFYHNLVRSLRVLSARPLIHFRCTNKNHIRFVSHLVAVRHAFARLLQFKIETIAHGDPSSMMRSSCDCSFDHLSRCDPNWFQASYRRFQSIPFGHWTIDWLRRQSAHIAHERYRINSRYFHLLSALNESPWKVMKFLCDKNILGKREIVAFCTFWTLFWPHTAL